MGRDHRRGAPAAKPRPLPLRSIAWGCAWAALVVGCRHAPHEEGAAAEAGPSPADESPLYTSSRTIELKMRFGETDSQEVQVRGTRAEAARLAVASIEPPGPDVAIVSSATAPARVRVSMTGATVGHGAGQVRLTTGLSEPRELIVLYSWLVLEDLTVSPTNPYVDLRSPAPQGVRVRVSSSRDDFRLEGVEIVDGPFRASFAREDGRSASYSVDVLPEGARMVAGQRGALGTLRLVSNDPAEPRKDVPLFAFGELP